MSIGLQGGTNGVISFGTEVSLSSPQPLPLSGNFVLVAPLWSDVDTQTGGAVFYQLTRNSTLLHSAAQDLQAAFTDLTDFSPSVLLIATWDHVSAYLSDDGFVSGGHRLFLYLVTTEPGHTS